MDHVPLNTPQRLTVLSSIRWDGQMAFTTYSGGTTGDRFVSYLKDILIPTLKTGDIVVMDNMRSWTIVNKLDTEVRKLTLNNVREDLANNKAQLENARTEMETPFAKEAELTKKTARLKELNILLNMDQKDRELLDGEPDEDDSAEKTQRKDFSMER